MNSTFHHEIRDFFEGVYADFAKADDGQQLCVSLVVERMRFWEEIERDDGREVLG